jgi:RimJ/RimL family protein N-acetyltransferase
MARSTACDYGIAMPSTPYRSATRPPKRDTRAVRAHDDGVALTTRDGLQLTLRPIRAGDADALRRGFARLTPEQVRLRTFHRQNELTPAAAERLVRIDPETTSAFVAVDADGEIRGEARLHADAVDESGEFGVTVDPSFTGRGIGRALLSRLLDDARRRGLRTIWGDVLTDNAAMLDFVKRIGAKREFVPEEPGLMRVSFDVTP